MQQGWGSVCEVYKWLLRHGRSGYCQGGESIRVQKAPERQGIKKPQSHGVSPHVTRMVSSAEGRQVGTIKVILGKEGCAGLAVVNLGQIFIT